MPVRGIFKKDILHYKYTTWYIYNYFCGNLFNGY